MTLSIAEQARRWLLTQGKGAWRRTGDIADGIDYYPGKYGYGVEHYLCQIEGIERRQCECGLTSLWRLKE